MCCTCNLILCSGVAFRCIQLVLVHKILIWKIFLWLYTSVRAYFNGSQEYYIYNKMRTVCLVFCKNTVLRLKFEMQRSLEQFVFFIRMVPTRAIYEMFLATVCSLYIHERFIQGHSLVLNTRSIISSFIVLVLKKRFLSTIDHCSL